MQVLPDEVVGDGTARPDGHLALAGRIPGHAGSRFDVSPVPVHPGVAVEPRIARIVESRRRGRNHGAFDTLVVLVETEGVDVAQVELHGHEGIPAQAVVHRELGTCPPRVLCVQREEILADVLGIGIALAEERRESRQEVGHGQAREHGRKLIEASGPRVRRGVEMRTHEVSAKRDLVRSPNRRDVVADTIIAMGVDEVGNEIGRRPERERTGHQQRQRLIDIGIGVDAHVLRPEILRAGMVGVDPVTEHAERVDHFRTQDGRETSRQRLRPVVRTDPAHGQDVVGRQLVRHDRVDAGDHVAREEAVLGIELVIDFRRNLVLVFVKDVPGVNGAARIARLREPRRNVQRRPAQGEREPAVAITPGPSAPRPRPAAPGQLLAI